MGNLVPRLLFLPPSRKDTSEGRERTLGTRLLNGFCIICCYTIAQCFFSRRLKVVPIERKAELHQNSVLIFLPNT